MFFKRLLPPTSWGNKDGYFCINCHYKKNRHYISIIYDAFFEKLYHLW